ncbi:MAG TPA: peptidoglycan-binding domain-containing protein [Myxococcaceae bacterium]|nr:peptidoglycan-binding domain-containing protein [Myxococcaceae bacterium]
MRIESSFQPSVASTFVPPPAAAPTPAATPAPAASAVASSVQRMQQDGFETAPVAASPLMTGQQWTPAPSLEQVRQGGDQNMLRPGMEGASVRELQRLLGMPAASQDGQFGDATRTAVMDFQRRSGLTPPAGKEGWVGKTTLEFLEKAGNAPTQGAGRVNLAEQLSSPNSLISRAIGHSEGTRSLDGGKTNAYYGHTDPGNGVRNQGTFSYQHGAASPEAADQAQLARFRQQQPGYEAAARAAGLDPANPLLAATFFDLYTQAPLAATGRGGLLDQLPQLAAKGLTRENLIEARVQSYYNPDTGRLDAPGLGNTESGVRRDQARRTDALMAVLAREGLAGPTPPTGGTPTPTPVGSGFPASGPTLSVGAQGQAVTELQQRLSQLGYAVTADGDFGSNTEAAVMSFQRAKGLTADGVVGPQTRAALASAGGTQGPTPTPGNGTNVSLADVRSGKAQLVPGSTGEAVKFVQGALGLRQTGTLDQTTAQAIISFKEKNGLTTPPHLHPATVGATTLGVLERVAGPAPTPGTGVDGLSARSRQQMANVLEYGRNNNVGSSNGDCLQFVWRYMTSANGGYGHLNDWNDAPEATLDYAYQFRDFFMKPENQAKYGLKLTSITNPYDAPPGAIVVVPSHNASGGKTPGTAHPFAGDIALATGTDRFLNDGPNMSYGGRDLWGDGKPNRAWVFVPNV